MAIQTFNRPCTRAEISRETELDRDAVHAGLKRLWAMNVIVMEGSERITSTYSLRPGVLVEWNRKTRSHRIKRAPGVPKVPKVETKPKRKRLGLQLGTTEWKMPEFALGDAWGKKGRS